MSHPVPPDPRALDCTRRSWLGWAAAVALPGCASAPPPPASVARGDLDAVRRQVQDDLAREGRQAGLAGLSLALVDDQRRVWAGGWGWADRAAGRAAHGDTRYRVGSVSKLFTATLALQLVAEGRWSLDEPMARWLPDLALATGWPDRPITLRQLLTHHAGLPRDRLGGMWSATPDDFRSLPAQLQDQAAVGPPGLGYAYSNLGYALLGLAIERVRGERFERLAQRRLLDPLGMPGSGYSAAVPDEPTMARAYCRGVLRREPGLRDVPAGGLNASVVELARFLSMQCAGGRGPEGQPVLDARWQREMLSVQNAGVPLDAGFAVGLGWHLSTFGEDTVHGGGPVAHHAGATFHHRVQLMLLPDARLGVVVASNDAAAGPVVSRLAQRALALLLQARSGVAQRPAQAGFEPAAPGAAAWTDAARAACQGDYLTPAGVLSVAAEPDRLRGRLDDRPLQLLEGQARRFAVRYRWGGWLPLPLGVIDRMGFECRALDGEAASGPEARGAPGGAGHLVAHLDGQSMRVGDRLPPPRLPRDAASLVGVYRPLCAEGEVPGIETVTLAIARGRLWASIALPDVWSEGEPTALPVLVADDGGLSLPGPLGALGAGGEPLRWWREPDGQVRLRAAGWTFAPVGTGRL